MKPKLVNEWRTTLPVYVDGPVVDEPDKAAAILAPLCDGEKQEVFFALPCDKRGKMIGSPIIVHKGTVDQVNVWTRDVFRDAIVRGAVGLVAAHNHPSGDVRPSDEDRLLTVRLIRAGRILDIALVDHVVVNGAGEYASIKNTIFIGHKKLDFEPWE
jgi:DNA repair protein RadC